MEEEVGTNTTIVKGKRTKRHRPQSPIPAFRVSNNSDHQEAAASSDSNYTGAATLAASTSSNRLTNTEEEEELANCLIMLAQGRRYRRDRDHDKFTSRRFLEASPNSTGAGAGAGGYYVYECKTCSKTFPSFQALGGHRASHKKHKLIPTPPKAVERPPSNNNILLSDDDETAADNRSPPPPIVKSSAVNFPSSSLSLQLTNRALYNNAATTATTTTTGHKPRVHECSICRAEFASGQALGGHMRRHRGPAAGGGSQTQTAAAIATALTIPVEEEEKRSSSSSAAVETISKKPSFDLDLNLPAMPDAEEVSTTESKLVFSGKQPLESDQPQQQQQPAAVAAQAQQKQQLVFSPPALVDCHY